MTSCGDLLWDSTIRNLRNQIFSKKEMSIDENGNAGKCYIDRKIVMKGLERRTWMYPTDGKKQFQTAKQKVVVLHGYQFFQQVEGKVPERKL